MKLKLENLDKDKLFFTSDTHFFHKNIIKYCSRPFSSVENMNMRLVTNWNEVVPKDGIVFHLGDFSLGAKENNLIDLANSLNGNIHLIVGNHERDALKMISSRFATIHDIVEIYVKDDEITYDEQHIVMCHYPMIAYNGSHRGSWQLFGHVHGGLSNKGEIKHSVTALDVGVDCHNFKPLSYQEVKELITKQAMK